MHTKVVGISYEGRQRFIEKIKQGDALDLVRDPNNKYDRNAIKILTKSRLQLGFVRKELAQQLADAMDRGNRYFCEVTGITGKEKDNQGVNIKIFKEEESTDAKEADELYCMKRI